MKSKILWVVLLLVLIAITTNFTIHFILSGFRIMMFGARMILYPILLFALIFVLWRIMKFIK